jgi:hypothetical protein
MALESDSSEALNKAKTVTVRLFATREAAALAAASLEAHGIKCWINADDCGGMYPNLTAAGGVRLHVFASDAEAAGALLDAPVPVAGNSEPENFPLNQAKATGKNSFSLWQFLAGLFFGVILCLLYQWTNQSGTKTYYHYAKNRKVDEEWIYKNGKLSEFYKDQNNDQQWDYRCYYDGNGVIVRAEADNNFDGKMDEFWSYADGKLVGTERDTDFNGTPDEFCIYSNGVIQQIDIKPNGSSYSTVREFFKSGVLTEEWRGGDSQGNFKTVVRYGPFLEPASTNVFNLLRPDAP